MFERLRLLYVYGCFQYDFFTVANDLAPIVLEAALGERFVSCYEGTIPMVDTTGRVETFPASDFKTVYDRVTGPEFRKRTKWRLRSSRGHQSMQFSGNLTDLLGWARMEGLLKGQRNRRLEPILVKIRNRSAHAARPHLLMPTDSARMIRDLAEIINHLWGQSTPGGHLYPAPLRRDVVAIGWDETHTTTMLLRRDQLEASTDKQNWTFIIVRAVQGDPNLWHYDREFESTIYPAEYLWGPGSLEPALAFLSEADPEGDEVTYQDRIFVVAERQGSPEPPRRPEVFLSRPVDDPSRTWHLVRADYPVDAYAHVRSARIPPSAYQALRAALSVVFPTRRPLERLLGRALSDRPELLGHLDFTDTSGKIADVLVDRLADRESEYQRVTVNLMLEVARMDRFPDLDQGPDGAARVESAQTAVAELRRWAEPYTTADSTPCSQDPGPCPGCAVEVLAVGTAAEAAIRIRGLGVTGAEDPEGIRVPVSFPVWL
jgi:hypothetical protein